MKSVNAFYYECPVITKELIKFEKVPTPSILNGVTTYEGKCINDAFPKNIDIPLSMKCYPDGRFEVSGSCLCQADYQLQKGKYEGKSLNHFFIVFSKHFVEVYSVFARPLDPWYLFDNRHF